MFSNFNETANFSLSSQDLHEPCKSNTTHTTSLNQSPQCQQLPVYGSFLSQDSEIVEFLIHDDYKILNEQGPVLDTDSITFSLCCFKGGSSKMCTLF